MYIYPCFKYFVGFQFFVLDFYLLFLILFNFQTTGGNKENTDKLSLPVHAETQSYDLVIGLSVAIAVLVILCVFLFCFGNWQLQKRKRDLQVKFDYDYEMMVKKRENNMNDDKGYVCISNRNISFCNFHSCLCYVTY